MYLLQVESINYTALMIVGGLINLVILYYLIIFGVSIATKNLLKEAEYQSRLLQEIARKNGVQEEVLEAHFNKTFKK